MKKFYFLAAAVIALMASCTKTELVQTDIYIVTDVRCVVSRFHERLLCVSGFFLSPGVLRRL